MSKQTSLFQFFGKANQKSKNQPPASNTDKIKDSSKENFKPTKPKFGIYDIGNFINFF